MTDILIKETEDFFDDGGHVVVLVFGEATAEEAGAYYQIIVFFIHLAHTETYLYLTQKARKTQKLFIRTRISQISQNYISHGEY